MSGGLGGGDGGGLLWIDIRFLSLKSIGLLCGYLTEGAIVINTNDNNIIIINNKKIKRNKKK